MSLWEKMLIIPIILTCLIVTYFSIFGHVDVSFDRSYHGEYVEVSEELEQLKKANKVQCQPVQCKEGANGIALGIMGTLFFMGSIINFFFQQKRLDKREKEIDNLKKELGK